MYCWLLQQIYLCNLSQVLWSRVTYNSKKKYFTSKLLKIINLRPTRQPTRWPQLRINAVNLNFLILSSLIIVCLYDRMWQIVFKTNPLSGNTNKLGRFIHYALDECIYTDLIFVLVCYYGNTEQHRDWGQRKGHAAVYHIRSSHSWTMQNISQQVFFFHCVQYTGIWTSVLRCIC